VNDLFYEIKRTDRQTCYRLS